MELKETIKLNGIRAELLVGIIVAERVYEDFGYGMVITSITDSRHAPGSLHYAGGAVDLRTRDIKDAAMIKKITETIRKRLTKDYDVVMEKDHIHIEYQPKYS
ncbi:hypothetical protein APF79_03520 [bacterium BRH_c32]|nr:MAG: hypothetical protein APF79_03520 [bacterium BRH_c32]